MKTPKDRLSKRENGLFVSPEAMFLSEELAFGQASRRVQKFQISALISLVYDCEEQSLRPRGH